MKTIANGKCSKPLHFAVLSDLHLLHKRNRASDIINNLQIALPDNSETEELDIIYLAGDVFDGLATLPDSDVVEVDFWIASLLRRCKKRGIKLRVLDGTKSHDWYQSLRFETINTIMKLGADVKYIRDLSIEYMEEFNIHVLYVPDEWQPTTDKTLAQVKALLRAKGLDKVDYAIMHGQFEYQLPPHITAQKHNSEAYLSIVRELIFIGHVHLHSRYDRIIAQGSFDRIAHGEEGPKGHVRATVYPDGRRDIVFVENVGAKKFVSVDCVGLTLEESLAKVETKVRGLPEGSFVRLIANSDNPLLVNMEPLVRAHSSYTWSKLSKDQDTSPIVEETTHDLDVFVPVSITQDNLGALLMERIIAAGASKEMLFFSDAILTEVL